MMTAFELVQSHYRAMSLGDIDAAFQVCANEIKWVEAAGSPFAGVYVGQTAVMNGVMVPISRLFADFRLEDVDFFPAQDGTTVIVLGWYTGVSTESGRAFRSRFVHVWRKGTELLVHFEQIVDAADQVKSLTI